MTYLQIILDSNQGLVALGLHNPTAEQNKHNLLMCVNIQGLDWAHQQIQNFLDLPTELTGTKHSGMGSKGALLVTELIKIIKINSFQGGILEIK